MAVRVVSAAARRKILLGGLMVLSSQGFAADSLTVPRIDGNAFSNATILASNPPALSPNGFRRDLPLAAGQFCNTLAGLWDFVSDRSTEGAGADCYVGGPRATTAQWLSVRAPFACGATRSSVYGFAQSDAGFVRTLRFRLNSDSSCLASDLRAFSADVQRALSPWSWRLPPSIEAAVLAGSPAATEEFGLAYAFKSEVIDRTRFDLVISFQDRAPQSSSPALQLLP